MKTLIKTINETILTRKTPNVKPLLIENWLEEYGIKDYTIKDNLEIDVDGSVNLYKKTIGEFPPYIQFGTVRGSFNCSYCKLTTLRGCPREVTGFFDCSYNNFTSLEGAPKKVGEFFDCMDNPALISLEGAPKKIGGNFYCRSNKLASLKGGPVEVGGDFDCSFNNLISLEGAPKKVRGSFYCKNNSVEFTVDDVNKICKVNKNIRV